MEILSETRISQQVITRIGRISLTRRPLELGLHRPPGELRITTLELRNIKLRPIDLNSRTIRPTPRRRLPRPRAELRTSNLIIRMLIQVLFSTDLTNTRRRLINIIPRPGRIFSRSLELFELVRINVIFQALESVFPVGGVEVAPGAAFGHMRIKPCFRVVTCLYVAGAVFEQLGNGLVMVGRPAVTGARLVRIGMVMVSTVAVIVVVHRVIVRSVPVGISGSIGITSSTSIRRVVLLRRIRSPGLIGPRALGTGVLRLTALGAAVVAGPSRRVAATRAIRALVGPGPRTMSPTGMRMRGRATQPAGMRSTTKSMSSTSPRHTQPSRTSHSSTSRMSRRRTPTMRPAGLISKRTAPTPTGMTGPIGGSIGMRSPRTTTMTATSIRMRGPRTTDMTATGIRMHRRRRGTRMRGRRPRRRVRGSRPITSTTGPTLASMTGPAGVGVTGAGVGMTGSTAGVGVRGLGTTTSMTATPASVAVTGPTGIRMRGSRPIASMAGPASVGVTGAGVGMAGSAAAGIRVRGLGTTGMTATGIRMGRRRRGARMRGRRVRIRMRGSRPIAGMAGLTGAITSMTGPAGVGTTGAGVAMAGSTAGGIRVRGFGTAARVATAPVNVAVTGPTGAITSMTGPAGVGVTGAGVAMAGSTAAGIRVRGLGTTTSVTATGIRMRGRRIRCRVRGSRPIASMAGPAGVGMAGSTAGGSGVRGFGTAARVPGPAGIGVAGPAGAGVAGAAGAGVGGGGGVGGCCGGVGGLGGLGVGMAGNGIETVIISSHARTSTSRRGMGRCSRHRWNGARERIQTMISPRTRPGRRALAPVTGR